MVGSKHSLNRGVDADRAHWPWVPWPCGGREDSWWGHRAGYGGSRGGLVAAGLQWVMGLGSGWASGSRPEHFQRCLFGVQECLWPAGTLGISDCSWTGVSVFA